MASGVRWDGEQPGAAAAAIAAASGGARGAAAMTESSPRGPETRERRVDCIVVERISVRVLVSYGTPWYGCPCGGHCYSERGWYP